MVPNREKPTFFMTKPDVARSMHEIERVLKPGGLVYVN
jgi:hypothetical protein